MRTSLSVIALASLAVASPLVKRDHLPANSTAAPAAAAAPAAPASQNITDVTILNYALTLEHLEDVFYREGLTKYSADAFGKAGYPNWVRERITEISSHETGHVAFVETVIKSLKGTPVARCTYKFPHTDPKSFLAVAQALEGVGVAAYLGAAKSITDETVLTAAGSILAIEARHASWIRSAVNQGDGFPQLFDTPVNFNGVFTMASDFFVACPPSNPVLPFKAFPKLTLAGKAPLKNLDTVTLTFAGSKDVKNAYAIFLIGLNQVAVPYDAATGSVQIPAGSDGQSYVVISSSKTLSDATTLAGPTNFEVPLPNRNFPYENFPASNGEQKSGNQGESKSANRGEEKY